MPREHIRVRDYIAKSLLKRDSNGEYEKVLNAIDKVFEELTDKALSKSWDIERAPREEVISMAESLGLFPQNFMTTDTLRRYVRVSGNIRELKGTDTLLAYLVDALTKFKVYEIKIDENNVRHVDVKLYRGTTADFDYQQRVLDFLVEKYKRLLTQYNIAYVTTIRVTWTNILHRQYRQTKIKQLIALENFNPYKGFPTPFELQPFLDTTATPFWRTIMLAETQDRVVAEKIVGTESKETATLREYAETNKVPTILTREKIRVQTTPAEQIGDVQAQETVILRQTAIAPIETMRELSQRFYTPFELVTMY